MIRSTACMSVFVFSYLVASIAVGEDSMRVQVPFNKLDGKTLDAIFSINQKLSKFSEGCSAEASEAANKLNRSLWTSAACGASLAASETGVGLVVAAIACTSATFAYEDRVIAEKGLNECKQMKDVFDKYKQYCANASYVTFFEKDKVHCVDQSGRLIYAIDFKNKNISIFGKR